MATTKESLNKPMKGMNRDFAKYNLDNNSYTFAYNSNTESMNGEGLVQHTNEPSNLLCNNFKQGYKVVGHYNDYNSDTTYFFITNPTTKLSEIGYISNISNFIDTSDVESTCNCEITVMLDSPLEEQQQTPFCNYNTLLKDCIDNTCLNFSIDSPILDIELNYVGSERFLYFTDNQNPVRYVNIDNVEDYYFVGSVSDCQNQTKTCLDCDKLRVFPLFKKPCLSPEQLNYGGNLKAGSYEFMVAYSDINGGELSNYFSITNPIYVFDLNNNILSQPELDYQTNLAIKLNVDNLDLKYSFFKIVSLEKDALNQETSYRIVGTYPISDNTVVYSSQLDKAKITLNEILTKRVTYIKAKGITSVNDKLLQYGLTSHQEVNLQPVVNLMGAFCKWVTVVAKENLYEDSKLIAETKGYMRDEVYPFSIKFSTTEGFETALFPFIPRPATIDEMVDVVESEDTISILDYKPICPGSDRSKKWQFYNTATKDSTQCLASSGGSESIIEEERTCTVEDENGVKVIDSLPNGELIVEGNANVTTLTQYVNDGGLFTSGTSLGAFNTIINNSYAGETCNPFEGSNCDNIIELSREIKILNVGTEVISKIEKVFPTAYDKTVQPAECKRTLTVEDENGDIILDTTFIDDFMLGGEIVYKTITTPPNSVCSDALVLDKINNPLSYSTSYHYFSNTGSTTLTGVVDSTKTITDVSTVTSKFLSNVHKGSLWYKFDFSGELEMLFEVSKESSCELTDDNTLGTNLRFSTFNSCTSSNSIDSGIFNTNQGTLIKLQRTSYTSDIIYIAVEAPVRQRTIVTNNSGGATIPIFTITPPCSCFHIVQREIEIANTTITFSNIDFYKTAKYKASCTYYIPELNKCTTSPYEKGNFSYWESESKYPCNKELYNSQLLDKIKASKIPTSIKTEFESFYTTSTDANGNYIMAPSSNFMNKPIRHYKFPCNSLVPFMDSNVKLTGSKTLIYPIGFSIPEDVISAFLDIAVDNELIDINLRNKITQYEIYRGDRRVNKSVLAKGLANDMYLYLDDNNKPKWYPNFPYNSLGTDVIHGHNHPYNSVGNTNYTFHSPDTHIRHINIGSEIKVEGYQYGYSKGRFTEVNNHPEWVIMGQPAYTLAVGLANLEVLFESVQWAGDNIVKGFGGTVPSVAGGIAASIVAIVAQVAASLYRVGKYRGEWLDTFRNLGTTNNFAYYYTSHGDYNYFKPNLSMGNKLRGLGTSKYIKPGDLSINQEYNNSSIEINNLDRERSVYLSLGNHILNYPVEYINFDNSNSNLLRASRNTDMQCIEGTGGEFDKNIASPLISIKNYVPNQYGSLNSIKWLATGKCGNLNNLESNCNPFFGGDIFISRFSLKRKIPLFSVDAMRQADLTPFSYSRYTNIRGLKYYVDYEVNGDGPSFMSVVFPDRRTNIDNMDCIDDTFYVKPPTKFYLYYYGIPNFLVESEINCNLRHGKREPHENFYPNTSDYVSFTQESIVPIRQPNTFFYNEVFSNAKTLTSERTLNIDFTKKDSINSIFNNNSVIYSDKNLWKHYKPLNYYEFPLKYGDLTSLNGIESSQLIGRFTNQTVLYNKLNTYSDGINASNDLLGNGTMFAQRPYEFNKTDNGYSGSQHKAFISCEFGHYWVDAKRGDIFSLNPNAQGKKNINGNMNHWFKEHLPFKILKGGIANLKSTDLDNQYKGLAIVLGWDNRFKRLFLTKLDYIVKDNKKGQLRYEEGKFYEGVVEIQLSNKDYFESTHFTVAYNPKLGQWVSYYSFTPNYYLSYDNYFKTGYNENVSSLWSHLLTNRSYQVFNGKKEPWIVEYPLVNKMFNSNINNIEYWLDTKRYRTRYDYTEFRGLGFNKATVYNKSNNSGILKLIPSIKNNLNQQLNYPIYNSSSIDILATENDKKWSFNYIYNLVKDETNLQPIWLNDKNQILKNINPSSISYMNTWKDRLRGDYFLVRMEQDLHSNYNMTLKWTGEKRTFYEQ